MSQETTTMPKPFCFVLMPFDSGFSDVYQIGIKEACSAAGAYCERVDEQIFQERILDRIYNQITKADFIIADMTGRNANVFYEVGYAHALGKITILLTRNADDIPFDLKHFPHIIYDQGLVALREELTKRVKWCIQHPKGKDVAEDIGLDLYHKDESLAARETIITYEPNVDPIVRVALHNTSGESCEANQFKVGIITTPAFSRCHYEDYDIPTSRLPGGQLLHVLPQQETLFPEEFRNLRFRLEWKSKSTVEERIRIRVFSKRGTRDFQLILRGVPAKGLLL